ncbi:cyclase family protein [Rhizobium leguminosarum]|uniref:cyclase family protein n=1 Tax=Rhizobium leguminosarum TaxID=384 RepID=UPI001C969339|nr:cyclase family protein [Rhizobium leguminosarum]MBY5406683.1 cyclase family protein [Rhizobium leguminosarum]
MRYSKVHQIDALLSSMTAVDLAPTLERGIPIYPTHPHLIIDPTMSHKRDGYYCQSVLMAEHTGCHCDAPAHIIEGMRDQTIEKLPPTALIGPAKVYDFSCRDWQPGQLLTLRDIADYEEKLGEPIEEAEIALINFGWLERYWSTDRGALFYASNQPGMDEQAVKFFRDRRVAAVGADTIACEIAMIDGVAGPEFGHQQYWLPNNILILECIANLHKLPRTCFLFAAPLPIKDGSGSPLRPIAYF